MSQPVIGIFVEKKNVDPTFKDRHYELAYYELMEIIKQKGAKPVILVGQACYEGNGKFTKAWQSSKLGDKISYTDIGPTKVDLVYDKDHFNDDDTVPVINPKALKAICEDKHLSYEVLEAFHPKSFIVQNESEFKSALNALTEDVVVVKGIIGSSGDAVFVGPRSEVETGTAHIRYPYQVQEFIETSAGIPGVVDTRHDLRLLMLGGEPILATLRTPPEGGYKSNLGYGGANRLVDLEDLPTDLFSMAYQIDKALASYAPFRLYSADFGLTENGWKLFEVNGWPGIVTRQRGEKLARYYQEELCDYLLAMYKFYYKDQK